MQEITMLTPYLPTRFHDLCLFDFSNLEHNLELFKGPKWAVYQFMCHLRHPLIGEATWDQAPARWQVCVLRCDKGSTDVVESVWPRNMASQPHGGCSVVHCHGIVVAKSRSHHFDAINTPLCSPLEYTLYSRLSTCEGSSALVVA
jgi:hypothetical protein